MSTAWQPDDAPDASRLSEPGRRVLRAQVTDRVLDVPEHAALVAEAAAGAVVTFAGAVRDHDRRRRVRLLEYEAHPSAEALLGEVAAVVAASSPVDAIAVTHRVGRLEVGEVALAVAVSAAHRRQAFEAAELLVEQVKARLPIWKHQLFTDGTEEWVACP